MLEMVTITAEAFAEMRVSLPAVTDPHLFAVFGISEKTWTKLRRGEPIKRSTLERALAKRERWRAAQVFAKAG